MENKIVIGDLNSPLFEFGNDAIEAGTAAGVFSVDVVGDYLAVDVFSPVVRRTDMTLTLLEHGTAVHWYCDGSLICKHYLDYVEQVGVNFFLLHCMSFLGLLAERDHVGGLYTGETFEVVAGELLGDIAFSCAADVAGLQVYGWLPYQLARDNLHTLCFALGVAIKKDEAGDPLFAFLSAASPDTVPDDRVEYGGRVSYNSPASEAVVTEYVFAETAEDDELVLFDNTDGSMSVADGALVRFSAPCHDLIANGLTITNSGVNYAVVSGYGTLTGRQYTRTERTVTARAPSAARTVQKTVNNTLVNPLNSELVAARVLAYYSSARQIRATIHLAAEKPGDVLMMSDPFGNAMIAFLQEASLNVTTVKAASCTLIEGYTPTASGNKYDSSDLISVESTFTLPLGGKIVLIGGGNGGQSGADGQKGNDISGSQLGEGGEGGESGAPGIGGRVYVAELPAGTYRLVPGAGGAGGTRQPDGTQGEGAEGTATELYDSTGTLLYSSANGGKIYGGLKDLITGTVYAVTGEAGLNGGKGGKPTYLGGGYDAESVSLGSDTWTGGANGTRRTVGEGTANYSIYNGGGGGGAAAGSNGADAADVSEGDVDGGAGGNATVIPDAPSVLGNGGTGGHGGGGGGASGAYIYNGELRWHDVGGAGGTGGTGGEGAQGGGIVYTPGGLTFRIVIQPEDYYGTIGGNALFSVAPTGFGSFSYQWQTSPNGTTWTDSTASTARTANFSQRITSARVGMYVRCKVTNNGNTIISDSARILLAS